MNVSTMAPPVPALTAPAVSDGPVAPIRDGASVASLSWDFDAAGDDEGRTIPVWISVTGPARVLDAPGATGVELLELARSSAAPAETLAVLQADDGVAWLAPTTMFPGNWWERGRWPVSRIQHTVDSFSWKGNRVDERLVGFVDQHTVLDAREW